MKIPMKRGEKGFTLIELLIVVAILGVLAAVVIPNVGRFLGKGEEEAKDTEFATVQAAMHAMMVDNDLPDLTTASTGGCTLASTNLTATNDMSAFPCTTGEYILYGHDHPTDNSTNLINYLATQLSSYNYYTDENGTLFQGAEATP